MTKLLYRLKARICEYLEWFNEDFDPEIDNYFVYEERGGHYAGYDFAPTIYWFEHDVVGKGIFRNWWYSTIGDTSA